jgi:hypothetical protein
MEIEDFINNIFYLRDLFYISHKMDDLDYLCSIIFSQGTLSIYHMNYVMDLISNNDHCLV